VIMPLSGEVIATYLSKVAYFNIPTCIWRLC